MADEQRNLLHVSKGEIPRPKTLPGGEWRVRAANVRENTSDNPRAPTVNIMLDAQEPQEDVDQDELAELGADYDYAMTPLSYPVWIRDGRDIDRIDRMARSVGLDPDDYGTPFGELQALVGHEFVAELNKRPYTDQEGEEQWTNDVENLRAPD